MPDKIPDYSGDTVSVAGQFNLLIAGKHDGLVDVMIFANINPTTRKIKLISIPRDLYYNNRKINSYYPLFGMDELKRVIGTISGYQIDKFVLIDMYAFIDVIDLIGGVDVHLDQAVIDPSYKTFDDGKWSTLYYRVGDYHLSGKQALRIARTRHSSSDFARANRQQIILKAIQTKAKEFGFGDAGTLNSIAQSVLSRTETDITLPEAIADYFRYQGFEIEGGNVLSTANVLESKFSGDLAEEECKDKLPAISSKESLEVMIEDKCTQEDKGQYLLVPKDDDWNILRWYFHQLIEN